MEIHSAHPNTLVTCPNGQTDPSEPYPISLELKGQPLFLPL
jgi:hypothetical protein